jgi:hypothetical protein
LIEFVIDLWSGDQQRLQWWFGWFMVFKTTFNNISVISWRSVLLVDETGVPRENHQLPQVTNKLKIFKQYFTFPPPKSEYFFQQHWESEYFFRKKP